MATSAQVRDNRASLDFLIRAFQVSRLIRLVADLTIADKIDADGLRDIRELAAACSVLPMPLLRVLRTLASFGIFKVTPDGRISHTPQSLRLRASAPNSLHYAARFFAAPGCWRAWGELDAALTGESPYHVAWGTSRFDYLRDHRNEARTQMAQHADPRHNAVADTYDFSQAKVIVDVGGGNGAALKRILARFPTPRGIVFDRPEVVAEMPPDVSADGRITAEGGSFFEEVPAGADLYLMMNILHNWSDEDCIRVLEAVRSVMPADARVLVVEHILEPDPAIGNPMTYLLDMQMMAMFDNARERTEAEFGELFLASGFGAPRLIPTKSPVSILDAAPV